MTKTLSKIERRRVLRVVEHESSYKTLKTPEEWHQFALNYNWDDGCEAMRWIIQQPLCDKGTALLIYWHASPTWYCQYGDRNEVIAQGTGVDGYDLTKEIEARYLSNFYERQEIKFDPTDEEYRDLLEPSPDRDTKQEIPDELKKPSPGERVERENLVIVTVRPLSEQEIRTVTRHLQQSETFIQQHNRGLTLAADPKIIVEEISKIVDSYRDVARSSQKPKRTDPVMSLGWLWCEQLRRAYGWQWMARDYETGFNIGTFTVDQGYGSLPPNLISYTIAVPRDPNKIKDLFEQLAYIERSQDLAEAYSRGWVMHDPAFKLLP